MSMIWLGLRNLTRSRLRLLITLGLLAIAFYLALTMTAIGNSMTARTQALQQSVNNTLQMRARGSMGHINMVRNDDLMPGRVLDQVRATPHVAHVESYLLAMTPTQGMGFAMLIGVEPGAVKRLESHGEAGLPRLIAGRDLTAADVGEQVAVIGQGYAKFLGISADELGSATVTLDLGRSHPVIYPLDRPARTLKVVGIYASGYVFGDMQLFMPLSTLRAIYGVPEAISWLYVTADSAENVPAVAAALRQTLGSNAVDIIAPRNVAAFQGSISRSVQQLTTAGSGLAYALMLTVVFFLMLLLVRERRREIGTLKALGIPSGAIIASLLTEAVAFTVLGELLAAGLFALTGTGATEGFLTHGLTSVLPQQYQGAFGSSLGVSTALDLTTVAALAATALGVALLGSLYSAYLTSRLSPLEAISHE
jgi:ABC-type antimicrobial peptide transport system permease subunit